MLKLVYIFIGIGAVGAGLVTAQLAVHRQDGRTERTYDDAVSASGARTLDIQAPVAAVEIETGRFPELSVHAVRWTKTPETSAAKHWMSDGRFSVTRSGDVVSVRDQFGSDSRRNDLEGNFHGGLEIHVKAPEGMRLDVHVGAGSVKPRGDLQSVDIHVGAGAVEGRFRIAGSSEVHVGAGEVELAVPASENLDVDAHAGVGSIVGLPESGTRSDRIHIGDNRSGRFGSGGSSLSIHVGAGKIQIDSPSAAKNLSMSDSGTRELRLDSEDSAANSAHFDVPDVGPIVSQALADSNRALSQAGAGRQDDDDLSDIGPAIEEAMKSIGPVLDKTLSQIGPDIDEAMRQARPEMDRDLAKIGPDIDEAMRRAQPDMDRDLAKIGPEIRRAMEKIRPEIERARREVRHNLDKQMPEIEKAMKQAQAEIDKASRDIDSSHDKDLDKPTREGIRASLNAAREAIRQSMAAARKAIEEAKRDLDNDKD